MPTHSHQWKNNKIFTETLQQESLRAEQLPYYMDEDKEERYPGVDELFATQSLSEEPLSASGLVLEISKDKYISLFKPWRGALIIKLLGKIVSYRVMLQRKTALWKLQKDHELIDLEGSYYVVHFFAREDYLKVLEGGPWIILGHYLTVVKWRPNFRPSRQTITSTLIWLRFREVPFKMFDEESLADLGDLVGKTVKADPIIVEAYRGRYARVCVEIDLSKPLLSSVTVLEKPQLMEYEGLQLICFRCGRYGHRSKECVESNQNSTQKEKLMAPTPKNLFGP